MSDPKDWLPIAGLVPASGGAIFLLRGLVDRRVATLSAQFGACDYVIIEAVPEQMRDLRTDFEANGSRLSETKPRRGPNVVHTFRKMDGLSSSFFELLGFGRKAQMSPSRAANVRFLMKIKEHGSSRSQDARPI